MSLECPSCNDAGQEDDSFFCDNCGVELKRCTGCGRLGKQKRCVMCGKALISLREAATLGALPDLTATAVVPPASPTPPVIPAPPISPAATPAIPRPGAAAPVAAASAGVAPSIGRIRLYSSRHSIDLRPADGDILGRAFGPHVATLGRFSQISTRHLQLQKGAGGDWLVLDLKSFNSTYLNGMRLQPHQAQRLTDGGVLTLADIELQVSIE